MKAYSFLPECLILAASVMFVSSCDKDSGEGQCRLLKTQRSIQLVCPDGTTSETDLLTVSYDSDGKVVRLNFDNGSVDEFFYDSNGRIIMIEEDYLTEKFRLMLTWEGNQVTRQHYRLEGGTYQPLPSKRIYFFNDQKKLLTIEHYYLSGGYWTKKRYDQYSWEGENFSKIEEFWEISKSDAIDYVKQVTTTFTWDNKPSPFGQNLAFALQNTELLFLFAKNNPQMATSTNHLNSQVEEITATYVYAENGYPEQMSFSMSNGNCTQNDTWNFVMHCF
jgi:hypothetical protein